MLEQRSHNVGVGTISFDGRNVVIYNLEDDRRVDQSISIQVGITRHEHELAVHGGDGGRDADPPCGEAGPVVTSGDEAVVEFGAAARESDADVGAVRTAHGQRCRRLDCTDERPHSATQAGMWSERLSCYRVQMQDSIVDGESAAVVAAGAVGGVAAQWWNRSADQGYVWLSEEEVGFVEALADALFPPDNQDGILSGGLHRFFTLHSRDWNVNRNNQPRLDINTVALDPAPAGLTDETGDFLEAKRKAGQPIVSLANLVNATLIVTEENQAQRELKSGVVAGDLGQLLDRFTTDAKQIRLERVNINTAPASILAQVEGIDEALANTIASARQGLSPEASRSIAWLLEESLLDAGQFRQIEPLITARSFQFHIQVIGYALPSGRYRVLEAIVDLIGPEPRVLYLRDLTKLGVPYPFATR